MYTYFDDKRPTLFCYEVAIFDIYRYIEIHTGKFISKNFPQILIESTFLEWSTPIVVFLIPTMTRSFNLRLTRPSLPWRSQRHWRRGPATPWLSPWCEALGATGAGRIGFLYVFVFDFNGENDDGNVPDEKNT